MEITIKRSTTFGLKEAKGTLLEAHGLQFCFTKCDEGLWFLIELSSGGNVKSIDADIFTKSQALKMMKAELNERTLPEFERAISSFIKENAKIYKLSIPVNNPVKT